MGVVNVTPDSFSDGGRYLDPGDAVAHGLAMYRRGADLIDIGGESTRPGAERVDAVQEASRVLPVIKELAAAGVPTSIDTTRSEVAAAAIDAGVCLVNDVSGGMADDQMTRVVAEAGLPMVLMHWRGPSSQMDRLADYGDVVADTVRTREIYLEWLPRPPPADDVSPPGERRPPPPHRHPARDQPAVAVARHEGDGAGGADDQPLVRTEQGFGHSGQFHLCLDPPVQRDA